MSYEIKEIEKNIYERYIDCDIHGKQIQRGYRFTSDSDIMWYDCNLCYDEEKERKKEEEQKELENKRLKKLNALKLKLKKQSEVPTRYQESDINSFVSENNQQEEKKQFCKKYIENFIQGLSVGRSMIFCGTTGTGKTLLACAIANEIIEKHQRSVLFTTTIKAIRKIKSTYSSSSEKTEQEIINEFLNYDLLILDELGVQFGSDSEKVILFEIINERYQEKKPTIMISNLAYESLRNYVDDRVLDRMREGGGGVLIFDWKSKRGKD